MPALTFAQGKLQLVYYDLREDVSQLFGPFVDELPILTGPSPARPPHHRRPRRAGRIRAARRSFTSFRLSQYRVRRRARRHRPSSSSSSTRRTCRCSAPARRRSWATTSTSRRRAPFVLNGTTWSFNTRPSTSPVFHAIWTDNRDVRPPADGNWTNYTPPNPPFARPTMSGFDPIAADARLRAGPGRHAEPERLHARITAASSSAR